VGSAGPQCSGGAAGAPVLGAVKQGGCRHSAGQSLGVVACSVVGGCWGAVRQGSCRHSAGQSGCPAISCQVAAGPPLVLLEACCCKNSGRKVQALNMFAACHPEFASHTSNSASIPTPPGHPLTTRAPTLPLAGRRAASWALPACACCPSGRACGSSSTWAALPRFGSGGQGAPPGSTQVRRSALARAGKLCLVWVSNRPPGRCASFEPAPLH